jgi:cell division transport system permease protein
MSDDAMTELTASPRKVGAPPRFESPIVPRSSISGRALVAVVGIMTFLASLTVGGVLLVNRSAEAWRSDVSREVTIQVRPMPSRNVDADVDRAVALAKGIAGIAEVRAMSKDESSRLLEPFLGTGLKLDELPVPRMVVVTLASGVTPDLAQLRNAH